MKIFLFSLSILLLLPNFFNITLEQKPEYNKIEYFDPSLSEINSVEKLTNYADSISQKKYQRNTLEYALVVSDILENRFYHGFSVYSLRQNWIAAVSEYLFGHYLANPVLPDDILKYPYAGCSQQAIVLAEAMKKNHVPFRKIGFPHHYATELEFNNSWYFFDTNMEPEMTAEERNLKNWNHNSDSLKKYYHKNYAAINWGLGDGLKAHVGQINAAPAPRAS
ncbi:MAG TPA: hypothetical protein VIJ75_07030, partial [Hanamia sp.]